MFVSNFIFFLCYNLVLETGVWLMWTLAIYSNSTASPKKVQYTKCGARITSSDPLARLYCIGASLINMIMEQQQNDTENESRTNRREPSLNAISSTTYLTRNIVRPKPGLLRKWKISVHSVLTSQ